MPHPTSHTGTQPIRVPTSLTVWRTRQGTVFTIIPRLASYKIRNEDKKSVWSNCYKKIKHYSFNGIYFFLFYFKSYKCCNVLQCTHPYKLGDIFHWYGYMALCLYSVRYIALCNPIQNILNCILHKQKSDYLTIYIYLIYYLLCLFVPSKVV